VFINNAFLESSDLIYFLEKKRLEKKKRFSGDFENEKIVCSVFLGACLPAAVRLR
jgi:hypothetical protein